MISIIITIVVIAALLLVGYGLVQRLAVKNLKFQFTRIELGGVDFTQTKTIESLSQVFNNLLNRDKSNPDQDLLARSQFPSKKEIIFDLIVNTKYIFNVHVDISNPSFLPATIDRLRVKMSVHGHELPGYVTLSQKVTIPPKETRTIELRGITVSAKDISSILYKTITNDYVLDFNFAVTSYYPTFLGQIPIPINIHLVTYPIPPKPRFNGLVQDDKSNLFKLSFVNPSDIPMQGAIQIGVMKGDSSGSSPSTFTPIDSGWQTFLRTKDPVKFDVELFEFVNCKLHPHQSLDTNIENPNLISNANSAFIMRWVPKLDTIPYILTIKMARIQQISNGEFSLPALDAVRNTIYNLGRNFGYVGYKKFIAPNTSIGTSSNSVLPDEDE